MDKYFWEALGDFGDSVALIDEHGREEWSYQRLKEAVFIGQTRLYCSRKKVIFLFADNDVGSLLCYLSALSAGHLIYLGKGAVNWPDTRELIEKYRPDTLLWKGTAEGLPREYERGNDLFGYQFAEYREDQGEVGDQLALLLSTSGSLSSPKLVRLSKRNISAAASQVAKALKLGPNQRAITSLPLSFIYGLSVVHSHLAAGASLVLTKRSVQDRAFWQLLNETGVTSLAGVPWTFRLLQSISFDPERSPLLRSLLLSGGPLEPNLLAWVNELAGRGLSIYSMYGQTEATGRICVLPPHFLTTKLGSVGLPVDGSEVICDADGNIVFRGPNVMLGYAESREDLIDTDDMRGALLTGDTGYLDRDGYLYITGRTSRVAKLFGLRINLDEIETFLGGDSPIAVTSDDQKLVVFIEKNKPLGLDGKLAELLRRLHVPAHCVQVSVLMQFPRSGAGKIRYGELQKTAGENRRS